jgi:hypothetical protein
MRAKIGRLRNVTDRERLMQWSGTHCPRAAPILVRNVRPDRPPVPHAGGWPTSKRPTCSRHAIALAENVDSTGRPEPGGADEVSPCDTAGTSDLAYCSAGGGGGCRLGQIGVTIPSVLSSVRVGGWCIRVLGGCPGGAAVWVSSDCPVGVVFAGVVAFAFGGRGSPRWCHRAGSGSPDRVRRTGRDGCTAGYAGAVSRDHQLR